MHSHGADLLGKKYCRKNLLGQNKVSLGEGVVESTRGLARSLIKQERGFEK